MQNVLAKSGEYNYKSYTENHVRTVLSKLAKFEKLNLFDFGVILSPAGGAFLENFAHYAKTETRRYFGNSVSLYTPLYISNYCDNSCSYCGFNCKNEINRGKLTLNEIETEFKTIVATGLEEILLLTGESRKKSDVGYIGEAVTLAKKYFKTIGLEVYPLEVDEYAHLHKCGADFVSIYQETYDKQTYAIHHPEGPKSDFDYRFCGQERAIKAGMRGVSFGALLGLWDFRKDAFATGVHAFLLAREHPHIELSFSVPRIRAAHLKSESELIQEPVGERELLQVMLALRLLLPYASINISTRERSKFRDNVIGLVANKISAGVKVTVGGHNESQSQKGDGQFALSDERSVEQIHVAIIDKGLQPVYTDYVLV